MNYFVPQPILLKGRHGTFRRGFTVAEILKMIDKGVIDEDEKFELIDGEIILVGPKQAAHEWIKYRLNQTLCRAAPDDWFVAIETTIYLNDRTFVEPDFSLVPRGTDNVDLKAPDVPLVIEVAHTTLRKDRDIKAPLYARFGFPEYWLINARTKVTTIYRKPVDGQWTETETRAANEALTFPALPGFSITFSEET
jgi:Uma2 family endonuclease